MEKEVSLEEKLKLYVNKNQDCYKILISFMIYTLIVINVFDSLHFFVQLNKLILQF